MRIASRATSTPTTPNAIETETFEPRVSPLFEELSRATIRMEETIVVGTDGSSLGGPTVGRAVWLARHDDADLVIVCAYAQLSRRDEAKNVATLGGDTRIGQVLGREAAGLALAEAMKVAAVEGATVTAALLIDGEPAKALVATATDRDADLIVLDRDPATASVDDLPATRVLRTVMGGRVVHDTGAL